MGMCMHLVEGKSTAHRYSGSIKKIDIKIGLIYNHLNGIS